MFVIFARNSADQPLCLDKPDGDGTGVKFDTVREMLAYVVAHEGDKGYHMDENFEFWLESSITHYSILNQGQRDGNVLVVNGKTDFFSF